MKIKQIELIGFKSFAETTVLPLHDGITCIVGPNGCGKSNIVDAFRWVLGEQSAKSLRGDKMEEVIFQGTDLKKQKGMSEVCLTITLVTEPAISNNGDLRPNQNTTGDTITVSRRLYRSGESEYLLNKKVCRLKDIRDLLLDTGLDVKSYSILDQNRISEIVNSKPFERRFLIEELAGVMKYKVRKAEAESKLESSRQNLIRINDIVIERKRQLGSLDRLAKKAEKYKKLFTEANELEVKIAKGKQSIIELELNSLLDETQGYEVQLTSQKAHLSELLNKIETQKIEIVQEQGTLLDIEASLTKWSKDLNDAEKKSAITKAHIENNKSELQRLIQQIEDTKERQITSENRLSELKTLKDDLETSITSLSDEITKQTNLCKTLEEQIKKKETTVETLRKELFKKSDELSTKRNELNKRYSHLEHLDYKEEIAHRDKEVLTKTIDTITSNINKLKDKIIEQTDEAKRLQSERQNLLNQINELEHIIEDLKQNLSNCREELAGNISRLESIKEISSKNPALLTLTEALNKNLTPLSDLIMVKKDFESAFEAILFEKINALKVDTQQDLQEILNIIKENNIVRTVLFYNPLNPSHLPPQSIPEFDGIIGRLTDYLSDNGSNQDIVQSLKAELSNIFIIEDINKAMTYIKTNQPNSITFVTPDGVIINSSGWITYGKVSEVLKTKRQGRELEELITALQSQIEELQQKINKKSEEKGKIQDNASGLHSIYLEKDKQISLNRQSIEEAEKDLLRKKRRLDSIDMEFLTINSEKDALKSDIEGRKNKIKELEEIRDTIQTNISTIQNELSHLKTELRKEQDLETSLKLKKTTLTERLDSSLKEITLLSKQLGEYETNIENFEKNKDKIAHTIEQDTIKLKTIEENIKVYLSEINKLTSQQQQHKEKLTQKNEIINILEKTITTIRNKIDMVSESITELNKKIFEKKLIKENIEQAILQKQGINLNDVAQTQDNIDEQEIRFNELNEKIRELGPVSIETIAEYEELKRDYDFLVKQQQDLIQSIEELEEAINRINTTTRKKLREAYNLLREKFNSVFTRLFGGGKADIILTDENNILEAGLEIVAQPPGKKNQNINQLSGGEKAFTSLALLFAGFLIKPSPLCILDEADAPLDESNTERFSTMIKELSKDTQFVIITHNRITMEISDYLYGITMEEPGISKSLSIKFKDIERVIN